MTQTSTELDRKELKIQALRERVAQVTAEAEDRVADLRVELTIVSQQANEQIAALSAERDELKAKLEGSNEATESAKSTS